MIKRLILTVVGLLLLIGLLGGIKGMQIGALIAAGKERRPAPFTVSSAVAQTVDWENTLNAIGTLEAGQGVMITAEAPGRVTELLFKGGQSVVAGEPLVTQDVSTETSQFDQIESTFQYEQSNFARISRLFQNKVLSRAEYDVAQSVLNSVKAQMDGIETSIAKKRIVAPFDGRLGLSLVDMGQDLSVGVPIVSLQALDSMLVNFSLPQQALARVESGLSVRVFSDAVPGRQFEGQINAIDTQINNSTRNVLIQATLDSEATEAGGAGLLPGMYVTLEVVLPDSESVLMIPASAVNFATYGDSVFIIEPAEPAGDSADGETLVVRQQFVQLGERRGDFVSVTLGLEEGQRVVSEGVFKVRNGAKVVLNEDGKIEPSLDPKPDNT